jgi:hypothetical protein
MIDGEQVWTIQMRNYNTGRIDIDRYMVPPRGPVLQWMAT